MTRDTITFKQKLSMPELEYSVRLVGPVITYLLRFLCADIQYARFMLLYNFIDVLDCN
jgi:hypothetical protein